MSIRETIQRHQSATVAASLLVFVAVIGIAYFSFKKPAGSAEVGQWFTTDDGATYFVDASDPIPPFDHNGKLAVMAHVARQDSGSALKVIYLERFTPDAKAAAEKIRAKAQVSADELRQLATGHEYKAPGESQWRSFQNPMDLTFWAHDLAQKQGCGKIGFIDPN
jgi:hypothetical protein